MLKRYGFAFILVLLLVPLLMSAFAPLEEVELPEALLFVIEAASMFLVTALLRWLGGLLGKDIQGRAAVMTALLSALIVSLANAFLTAVPVAWESLTVIVLEGLAVWLGGMGFYRVWKATALRK